MWFHFFNSGILKFARKAKVNDRMEKKKNRGGQAGWTAGATGCLKVQKFSEIIFTDLCNEEQNYQIKHIKNKKLA